MEATNKDLSAFNMMKIKSEARRHGRGGWNNPLQLLSPRRRNTANDAERGQIDHEGVELDHTQTAPPRMLTPNPEAEELSMEREAEPSQQSVPESQATYAGSATGNGEVRLRKSNTGRQSSGDDETDGESKKPKGHSLFKQVKAKEPFTIKNQLEHTLFNSWLNILLLAAPAGIALFYAGIDGKVVFAVNFIAIIPLAAMLGMATEEIALRTGETLGGLINATFGNAVELIVAIMALVKNEVQIVQTSLIGSILSNLLLVLGMCFFAGGFNRKTQYFNKTVAQTAASLLALAVASIIVPTVFNIGTPVTDQNPQSTDNSHNASISRGVSVILLVVYGAYLFFQLKTHSKVFNEESQKVEATPWRKHTEGVSALAKASGRMAGSGPLKIKDEHGRQVLQDMKPQANDEDDEPEAELHFWVAVATLTISTVIIALCAEFMVDGIQSVTESGHVSQEFIGLILLPIVGNAAEHATAVSVAMKDKMDLAIGVAVGSSMQVSLFLIPLLVIIGWGMGNDDMNLAFDTFQVAVLFVSVLLVNYLIGDGESHWLEGFLLMCLYFIIAVCSWCRKFLDIDDYAAKLTISFHAKTFMNWFHSIFARQ